MADLMVDRAPGSGEGRSAAPTLRGGGSSTSPVARKHPGKFHRGAPRSAARSRGTPGTVVPGRGGQGGGEGRKGRERERGRRRGSQSAPGLPAGRCLEAAAARRGEGRGGGELRGAAAAPGRGEGRGGWREGGGPRRSGRGRVNPSRLVARLSRGTAPSSARDRSLPAHSCPRFLRTPLCAWSRDWAHTFGCGEWEKGCSGTVRRVVLVSWEFGGKLSAWKPACDGAQRLLGGSGNFSSVERHRRCLSLGASADLRFLPLPRL